MLYTDAQKQEHTEEILTYLYQIALRDSRIPIVLPGKEFTEEAGLAVRAYQEAYGLPVTGEIDDDTWNSIVATYREMTENAVPLIVFPSGSFLLREGDSGELVLLLQVLLRIAGNHFSNLSPVPASGIYDAETAAAVSQLQEIASLPQTGTADRKTWNALASLMNSIPLGI
ncbi:MAG: peptidoglycan-binding protein [Oscillospiraceae bacterium]|nr:peptidoglycan-binding protein [Oscillospiraceae bacterium]